jgi:uncharacterized protein (TIGR02145 family)
VQVKKDGAAAGSFTITASGNSRTAEALVIVASTEQTLTRVLRLFITPAYAASAQTWTFGSSTLVWSDAIQIPDCDKDDFADSDTDPKCRSYTEGANTWYYYNWPYVIDNAATLCPAPWRVPTKADFDALVAVTNAAGLIAAWGYGGYAYNSGISSTSTNSYYWSSTQYDNDYAYNLYYKSDKPLVSYNRFFGFQVRCVK